MVLERNKRCMKVAIDISPIQGSFKGHKVRGVGFYLEYLKRALLKYYPENDFIFFTQKEEIPNDVDLVHYPYFEPFFVSLPLLKRHKTIVTVHDLTPLVFPQHFPAGVKGNLSWLAQKWNLQHVDGVITDSVASQKDITKIAGIKKENVFVAYLAAAEEFKSIEKKDLQIEKLQEKYNLPEKFVLYVGDVTWNKNLPRFIEAMKKTGIPLVMVGKSLVQKDFDATNPWNSDLVKVNHMTEGDTNIIKLGFVSTDDLVALYNIATVFVMPSVYEGFGLPILEAMQSGCPVITTKEGSLSEVAGDAAYYIDGYDIHDMAEGIEKVFSDKELQKELMQKGFEQAKKFSWKNTAENTVASYKKVLHID